MKFEDAVAKVNGLSRRPADETLLDLYGLYKQATMGDCKGAKPNYFLVKGKDVYKWEAWDQCRGMTEQEARFEYVNLVKLLLKQK
ncbi:MAG: acyl-CoA-binding protein [Hyperionvirus sp.]|uniref:Acyl-CoA-binding protein n=1 Tax=Hyperionvirus sp. TaxID=2487770 RepID=A0A3G5AAI0_9VIRU|nr:MAG: acyl-CoA-binding protein [Hyperionvirus sp.]